MNSTKLWNSTPPFPKPMYREAFSKLSMKDTLGALTDLNKAIELNPKLTGAYISRGMTRAWLGDFREAMSDLNKAIKLEPENAFAYTNRGNVKILSEDFTGAEKDLSTAIALEPVLADAYLLRAEAPAEP